MLDDQWFESWQGLRIFLFTTVSRPALESTHSPIQWVPVALFPGVKRPGREADHSAPFSAECVELYLPSPSTPPWHGAQLRKINIKVEVKYILVLTCGP
jgi:hypothetical protein